MGFSSSKQSTPAAEPIPTVSIAEDDNINSSSARDNQASRRKGLLSTILSSSEASSNKTMGSNSSSLG